MIAVSHYAMYWNCRESAIKNEALSSSWGSRNHKHVNNLLSVN